jgi:secreted Zn-dependent insulinase-like peptidase
MGRVLYSHQDIKEEMKVLDEVTFKDFLKFKSKFTQTLRFEGLITGHVTKDDAVSYCNIIRENIEHRELSYDDKFFTTNMLKLNEKTVHNF